MLALQAARRSGCARPDRPSWSGIVIRADAFVPQLAQHMGLRARMRGTLFASLDMAAKEAEEEARGIISAGVQHFLAIGEEHLPAGVRRPHRVFRRTYCRSQRAVRKAATRSHLVPISLIKTATSATASWKRRHNIPMSQSALRREPSRRPPHPDKAPCARPPVYKERAAHCTLDVRRLRVQPQGQGDSQS